MGFDGEGRFVLWGVWAAVEGGWALWGEMRRGLPVGAALVCLFFKCTGLEETQWPVFFAGQVAGVDGVGEFCGDGGG